MCRPYKAKLNQLYAVAGRGCCAAAGSSRKRSRRNVWALPATIIVLSDIKTAPTAGGSTKPNGANAPAAIGNARTL